MKTIPIVCRLLIAAILMGASAPVFGNQSDNNGDNGTGVSDGENGDGQQGSSDGSFGEGGFLSSDSGDTTGGGSGGGASYPTPNSIVTLHLDPNTGTAHTGSPMYFTGQYSMDTTYGPISQVMIEVIAPDGTLQIQTFDVSYAGPYRYTWTTSFTFSATGTYQVLAALYWASGEPWSQNPWNYSMDGGVTWQRNSSAFGSTQPGNITSFTVDDGTHPPDTVYARAFPKPGMEKWFLPSTVVSKTFQIIGKTNPAPDANGNF
jgi:hypothetical protein